MPIPSRISLVIMILLFASCDRIYRKYDKESFPSYTWQSGQGIIFTPKIEDVSKSYELVFGLRHVYGLKMRTLAISVQQIAPSGKESSKDYQLTLIDGNGEYISSCGGDLCDIEVAVETDVKFDEAGEYKFIVTHNMPLDRIPGIMEVGLIINTLE
jgi:gliding motility-associated lipoprotein GldH